jgi:hypothetical protein
MNDVWGRPGGGAPMMKLKDQIISPRKHSGIFFSICFFFSTGSLQPRITHPRCGQAGISI